MISFDVKIYLTDEQVARLREIAKTRTALKKEEYSLTEVLENMINLGSYEEINNRLTFEEKFNEFLAENVERQYQ